MKQRTIFGLITITAFILFLISMVIMIDAVERSKHIDPLELETMTHEQIIQRIYENNNSLSLSFLLPLFGFFGVLIGALVYFLMSNNEFRSSDEYNSTNKSSNEIKDNNTLSKDNSVNIKIVRRMLSHDERKVFDLLISRHGMLMQSEVSSIEGFNKVKSHRIIDQLESKGLITKTTAGKQRVIRLMNEFNEIIQIEKDGFTKSSDGFNNN